MLRGTVLVFGAALGLCAIAAPTIGSEQSLTFSAESQCGSTHSEGLIRHSEPTDALLPRPDDDQRPLPGSLNRRFAGAERWRRGGAPDA